MSKQIKNNCHTILTQIHSQLKDLQVALKTKKPHPSLQKLLTPLINDFKFFIDDFNILSQHLEFLQLKTFEKDMLISTYEKQILAKDAQNKMFQQMIKTKYDKKAKEHKFLDFIGKTSSKHDLTHHRYKSQFFKKGLSQLEKDIVDSNKRVCSKVKQLQSQIQNQEQGYLTFQNHVNPKKNIFEVNLSNIGLDANCFPSPSKALEKKEKIKALQLDLEDNITVYKTVKKQLGSKILQERHDQIHSKQEQKSSETVVINRKKREELADLIAQQTKIIVSRERYFSTDI